MTKEELDQEINAEEFEKEVKRFLAWVSKRTRSRRSWLYAMESWARGDR